MDALMIIFLCGAGFLAGFIDSVAGGGGLITLPAILVAGLPAQMALGTNKFQSAFGTTLALANFTRKAKVVWKVAAIGVPVSLVASVAGARLALIIPETTLARIIVAIIPPVALLVIFSKTMMRQKEYHVSSGFNFWFVTPLICAAIGLYDGFLGPGTGTFLIITLVLVSNMPLINATATAKTFNLASNVGALVTFIVSGHVYYIYGLPMAVANIGGNLVGSHYAMKHGAGFIKKILIFSLSLLFIYLIWKYF